MEKGDQTVYMRLVTDISIGSMETEIKRAQTSISSRTFFTTEEEQQMEEASDKCHSDLQGDTEKSYLEHQNEKHTVCTEAQVLTDHHYLSSNTLHAGDQDKMLVQPALEKRDSQVNTGGKESSEMGEVVPAVISSPVSGLIASHVTELGSVPVVEDLCLETSNRKECADEAGLVHASSDMRSDPAPATACGISSSEDETLISGNQMAEHSHPPDGSRLSSEEVHLTDQSGLLDFEVLRAQLLSGRTSHIPQGPSDCKLCGRSFSLLETLRIHQLLHRLDEVCSCVVCGRSMEAAYQSGREQHRCDDCGKNFVQQRNVKRHQRTHWLGPMCADS